MQPGRIAQRRLEKLKLLFFRPGWLRLQRDRHDRMLGAKIFQVRLEEAKEQFNGVSRLRNLEPMLVLRFIGKCEAKSEFLRDKIQGVEPTGEMFKKTSQDEEKWLDGFDLVLELDLLGENFLWPNESQQPGRSAIGLFPKPESDRSEPGSELIRRESRELAEGVDSPFVENREEM